MKGRRISHFGGKGRLFLLMFGYESETAKHLFVSKIYSIAAQSFPFKVQTFFFFFKKGCMVHCVVCYRNTDININTSASYTVPVLLSVHCYLLLCWLRSGSLAAQTA